MSGFDGIGGGPEPARNISFLKRRIMLLITTLREDRERVSTQKNEFW